MRVGVYEKLPVLIEAVRYLPELANEIADWCGGTVNPESYIEIPTLEGTMRADVGDFIIKGVKGEFYPCKPDIFAATYRFHSLGPTLYG